MLSYIRSKPPTKDWQKNFDAIDWSKDGAGEKKPRGVRILPGGGFDCGIRVHDHGTFAEAVTCTKEG